ncbi:hypothetical protein PG999_004541 [Apiospora kogelbergensis]|uniref:Uncharacterized protein n=1 Tax=Apiospora kogelbergensis TaxID=1337665 RepID=A0AAW0QZJ2_9PEZI
MHKVPDKPLDLSADSWKHSLQQPLGSNGTDPRLDVLWDTHDQPYQQELFENGPQSNFGDDTHLLRFSDFNYHSDDNYGSSEDLHVKPSFVFASPTSAPYLFAPPCPPLGSIVPQVGISPNAQISPSPQFALQDTEQLTHAGEKRLSEHCISSNETIWVDDVVVNNSSKTDTEIKEEVFDMWVWSYCQQNPTASQEEVGNLFTVRQR